MRLKTSLAYGEKCWNKAYGDAEKACWVFGADQKVLLHMKDDQINALKGLEEEVAAARQKS